MCLANKRGSLAVQYVGIPKLDQGIINHCYDHFDFQRAVWRMF